MNTIRSNKRRLVMVVIALFALLLVLAGGPTQVQGQQGSRTQPNQSQPEAPLGSGFTYQGQLKDGGNPANGQYDFQFRLYDASSGGTQVGSTLTMLNQTVTGGLFTTQLDFGATAYQGQGRWLEIGVRVAGGPTYTALSPRQPLNATPYAASLMPGAVVTGTSGLLMSAISNGSATGLYGQSSSGQGVYGTSASGSGVYGETSSSTPAGVFGRSLATSGNGVIGEALSGAFAVGVWGRSTDGMGIYGTSTNGRGVVGTSTSNSGVYGTSTSNSGVYGTSSGEPGVYGTSTNDSGVYGESSSIFVGTAGVSGKSLATFGTGVHGEANVGSAARGVYGTSNPGIGVQGSSATNYGVSGFSTGNWGIKGYGTSGIWGDASASLGTGVNGTSPAGPGVSGTTGGGGATAGVRGISTGAGSNGVWGTANNGTSAFGVWGESSDGYGVAGKSTTNWGIKGYGASGVWGDALASNGTGVSGSTYAGIGVHGVASTGSGWAGYFQGNVSVTGSCCAAGMGTYKIDHPADPENKYLIHSAVASPDMKTIYDGNVALDGKGEAVVVLPDYFEELNSDFRYQFAPIGSSMPDLYIAEKVRNNRFKIGGGKPEGEVSWQVTGIRKDPYAKAHPIEVEVEKSPGEKGKYQHPAEWGQPESKGIGYDEMQRIREQKEQLEQRDPVATPQAANP